MELETALYENLSDKGVILKRYSGTLLHEPEDVATGGGTPFKVFTPFWRACNRRPAPHQPVPISELTLFICWIVLMTVNMSYRTIEIIKTSLCRRSGPLVR